MASSPDHGSALAFLDGGGVAADMIRARDWSGHPLGAPEAWPAALKTALGLVLNSPESMILAWGAELSFFFNDTYFPLLGPRLEWAMGERFDRVWADGWDQARPIVEDALAGRTQRFVDLPWTLATDRGEAETWWSFSYSRVLDEAGQVAGLFILTSETTAKVKGDAALVRSQAELASALTEVRTLNETLEAQVEQRTAERDRMWRTSPDLMVVLDAATGRYKRANPAWETLLGYAPGEIIGHGATDLAHPDDVSSAEVAAAQARRDPLSNYENRVRHKDGSYRWFSWVAAPSGAEIFCIGRHITAQKEAEAALRGAEDQLRQSQKVEAVGQLTGGVAHDFNNLLTVIRGSVELLRRPGLSEERRTRYVDAIADTADRATKLTGQLLAFARRQALKPETFDACVSIQALKDMIASLAGPRIGVELDLPDCPHFILADRGQFDTAIVNMAVNARDAMQGAGCLRIAVDRIDGIPALRAHPAIGGQFVTVTLIDSGAGIAIGNIDHVFEPFFTTKGVGEGTGLGLSQVFGFAKQSGGDVLVESAEGDGARFTLYLPYAETGVPADRPTPADQAPSFGRGACVLVVEDNPEVGEFATQALDELGYRTVLARDAAEALAVLAGGTTRFDVIFSDVMMPGMSGIEFGEEVRRLYPALPVILTSGYSNVLAESGRHGFELLHKPYSIDGLSAIFQRVAAHPG